ncbi:MAG TPA: family 20 glycosylhydrolase [Parafilimonas sp.]|nr:family 20 glycosylhydrolase [Parafilimonas sp.]
MKKITIATLLTVIVVNVFSQTNEKTISLIPVPVSMKIGDGNFLLTKTGAIELTTNDADAKRVANFLSKKISTATGFQMPVKSASASSAGNISVSLINDATLGNEGYKLEVNRNAVALSANKPAGLFYGMQTILQLLPKEIESSSPVKNISWTIPSVNITDYPRFGWRGLLFDVSRHFFTKAQVETFIDNMVKYKYNVLHLHLTDDQGWRIEIKSLPNLTKIGAWRPERKGAWGNLTAIAPDADEPKTYGGFYTQEDIKELVQYAKDRFVNILPEIDVPAHSMAAVASYPELSCTPGTYLVNASEEFQVWSGDSNRALIDNTLCPANEKVYDFLDKVFTEVAQLFPFEYIHVGGDEAAKNFWEQSEDVKNLMQREGLKNVEEVQSYFVKRVEKIVQSKGKKLIGWDEILQGGLAPNAAVMSWRGTQGGIDAAKQGHQVVMSPLQYTYVDLMQGDPYVEPPEFGTLLFDQSYKFDPIPKGVDPNLILGGEACLWSEHTTNMRAAGYLLWPRSMAVAECVWSPAENKNWTDFVRRVENHFERMDVAHIKYSRSMYNPVFHASLNKDSQLVVELQTQLPLDIYYSFDETNPDDFYPKYEKPLVVPKDALHVKVISYRDGKPIGTQINMPVAELIKRARTKSK